MPVKKTSLYFYETFGLIDCVISRLQKRTTFYKSKSFLLDLIQKVLKANLYPNARALSYGNVAKSSGIRKAAYERALKKSDDISVDMRGLNLRNILHVDAELIVKKFLFERIFKKYEYYGLVAQYRSEKKEQSWAVVVIDSEFFERDLVDKINTEVHEGHGGGRIEFVLGVFSIPVYFILFYLRHRGNNVKSMDDSIICEVQSRQTYDMFSDLFGQCKNVRFVIQKYYLRNFSHEEVKTIGMVTYGFGLEDYRRLRAVAWNFMVNAISGYSIYRNHGLALFDLYRAIAHGVLVTVKARRSTYITYEHMNTIKAIRNELLRADGNKSVFLPKDVYAIDHFYVPEYRYNYDILCSSGELLERIYAMQNAKTNIVLRTGSYASNKKSGHRDGFEDRISRLREFKGADMAITILSNGIQDETYSGEARLMALAGRLSEEPGVKVFIRPKPVAPPAKFARFFPDAVKKHERMLLTGPEYDLFDFLEVTDLFVTTNSSSAPDLCVAGADFFAIDFWDDKDLYLWQTSVEGVYLAEDDAIAAIIAWLRDYQGSQRMMHKRRMSALSGLISYKFEDFTSYKANLLVQLNPYFPSTGASG